VRLPMPSQSQAILLFSVDPLLQLLRNYMICTARHNSQVHSVSKKKDPEAAPASTPVHFPRKRSPSARAVISALAAGRTCRPWECPYVKEALRHRPDEPELSAR